VEVVLTTLLNVLIFVPGKKGIIVPEDLMLEQLVNHTACFRTILMIIREKVI
jgi:hypothetical protein